MTCFSTLGMNFEKSMPTEYVKDRGNLRANRHGIVFSASGEILIHVHISEVHIFPL